MILLTVTTAFILLNSCGKSLTPEEQDVADGKELAKIYCTRCHQLPDPAQLDKKTWETGVLPAMARRLHLQNYMGLYFADSQSLISDDNWRKIVAYFKTNSPVRLIIPKPAVAPLKDWAIFSAVRPKETDTSGAPAMTTYTGFDSLNRKIYTGDATGNLFTWDGSLNRKLVRQMSSPVTDIKFGKNAVKTGGDIVTCIGILPPRDRYEGKVIQLDLAGKLKDTAVIGEGLPRPVQTVAADFNKDGLTDYVVCGFGHENGGLYLLQQQADHSFKQKTIRDVPGGEQLITGDFNHDGWTDVMCLFAQADEGIWMFLSDHKGGFITKNLLHFPAIYGSSSFQLVDFNHDGKPDILYTCGDNSDFSTVLKPYHGLYIFTNQGDWQFKQTYFYHSNGATKAIAADFDHDGDLDIAMISFFPDLKDNPDEGFIYMEQNKPGKFIVHELPVSNYGRWLNMAVADIYNNGNLDIILGNFSITTRGFVNQKGVIPKWDKHEPIIILKNNTVVKHN